MDLYQVLQTFGLPTAAAIVLAGVVWWFIRDLRADRDMWRSAFLRTLDTTERQANVSEKTVQRVNTVLDDVAQGYRDRP